LAAGAGKIPAGAAAEEDIMWGIMWLMALMLFPKFFLVLLLGISFLVLGP